MPKIERYILVRDNGLVVRSNKQGVYKYVPLSDPDFLDKAFIFKTLSSARRSLYGYKHGCPFKIIKISGELTLGDEIEK